MLRQFLLFVSLLHFAVMRSECSKLGPKLKDLKWQCETICTGSGSRAEFNVRSEICKCWLGENLDDTDVEVMKKDANNRGINLDVIQTDSVVVKRNIETTTITTTPPPPPSTTMTTIETIIVDETTELIDNDLEGIVGQAPSRRQPHYKRVVSQMRPREPRPISPDQQRQIMQQIRDHLNRLNQHTDQNRRQVEISAMKQLLRQLSHSIVVQNPQQRTKMSSDRLRTLVQQVRQRQNFHRLIQGPKVGDAKEGENDASIGQHEAEVKEAEEMIKRRNPHFEIITQDPSLVDD